MNQAENSNEGGNQNSFDSISTRLTAERISLKNMWTVVWRGKILVLTITAVFVALSALGAFLLTPIYRADVLMVYVGQGERGGGLSSLMSQYSNVASLAGINIETPGSRKNEAIATLLSRAFTLKFIGKMNIMPNLFPHLNGEKRSDGDPSQTKGDAFTKFDEDIRGVTEDKKTGLITLSIDFNDRFLAAEWANSMVSLVNSSLRQAAIDESTLSIEFLKNELEKTGPEELRQSIYNLMEGHIANIMLANVRDQYAFKVIDPAVVVDEDAFEKPKRLLIIVSSGIVGLLLAVFMACFRSFVIESPIRSDGT